MHIQRLLFASSIMHPTLSYSRGKTYLVYVTGGHVENVCIFDLSAGIQQIVYFIHRSFFGLFAFAEGIFKKANENYFMVKSSNRRNEVKLGVRILFY